MTPEEIEHVIARAMPGVTEEQWAGLHQAPWLERAQRVVQALKDANLSIVGGGALRHKPEPLKIEIDEEFERELEAQGCTFTVDDPIPYTIVDTPTKEG